MTVGIWVLGNQLWRGQAALASGEGDRSATPVLLIESHQFAQERPYHRQKLVLVWSAMAHFAQDLEAEAGRSPTAGPIRRRWPCGTGSRPTELPNYG